MMGPRHVAQGALFYEFSIDAFVRRVICRGRWIGMWICPTSGVGPSGRTVGAE
jgi:hypothetical protein